MAKRSKTSRPTYNLICLKWMWVSIVSDKEKVVPDLLKIKWKGDEIPQKSHLTT